MKHNNRLINISKSTFISVLILLFILIIASIVLTYILPKGEYGLKIENGTSVIDYQTYIPLPNEGGIPIWRGILAPILLLSSSDGLNIIVLSLFLLVITGAFQNMSDNNGVRVIVGRIVERFKNKKFLLLSIISLVFMLLGSLLGLFEEMLTLLPIIAILAVSIGYDSFTGFLVSIVACGFGFSSAITNPFTVIFASKIIDVNPMKNVWYRIIIFIVMYALIELAVYLYTKILEKHPEKSYTYSHDLDLKNNIESDEKIENEKRIFNSYIIFFSLVLFTIILCSSFEKLREYTVVALIAVFLIGGILTALFASNFNIKQTLKSFLKGVLSALPTIVFVLMASSIKYILVEGKILPTITNTINTLNSNKGPFTLSLLLFVIILVLEFFISSSTAKAIFVMSILGVLNLGVTKEMLVLIYTFADGYTNLLFPTSPVLLIGLSMIGFSYFKWIKKSWPFFIITFALVIIFILIGLAIKF